ncbi:MAG: hypothetical protein NTV01_18880 [Bacteroidia bacterium]|nr:hypothetical protein [Bacteroidia bacterium]
MKFSNTEKIHAGDTIFHQVDNKLVPLFIVENISSVSCVGKLIDKSGVKIDDEVIVNVPDKPEPAKVKAANSVDLPTAPDLQKQESDSAGKVVAVKRQQNIQGSLSVSSYSNLSNTSLDNSQRMRYTFSLRASNLAKSRFSTESYISFSHKINNWAEVRQNVFNALKIYSLAIKYDISKNSNISLGRKVNPSLSNIGAVDGIQAETTVGQFTMGAVAGSRPNDADYNINFSLHEYGAFIGHNVSTKVGRMQSSAAFFEQRNGGITDRRFAYFQHDNSLLKNLYLFSSCELDLYKVVEGISKNQLTLTSLYLSLRYKVFKQLSLFASYDARKNVIYYETYKSFADRLLEDATRQGLQFRINYRPGNQVSMGVNAGYRFRDKDLNPNENLNGFISFNRIPWIKTSATLTANLLKTSYLEGKIVGIRLSRDIIPGKLFSDFNYQFIDYNFINSNTTLVQNIAQANLSWQFKNKMSFSLDYELTMEKTTNYHRIYISFNKRF